MFYSGGTMKDLMKKMLEKDSKKDDKSKEAKMSALKELHEMASKAMEDDMDSMKKVTVASKDDEGLEAGLEKAKEMLKKKDDDEDSE